MRVWPAEEYTRVTLEHTDTLHYSFNLLKAPERLVVDIAGVELNEVLDTLPQKIAADDPHIKLIRAGQFKPEVVRLVIELKDAIKPQVFTLKPVGDYQSRLVFDLYPLNPPDPLLALLKERQESAAAPKDDAPDDALMELVKSGQSPDKSATNDKITAKAKGATRQENSSPPTPDKNKVLRLVTIMLDPGHGGEDPGAIGHSGHREKDVTLAIAGILKKLIDKQPNMRAALTRDGDFFVPLALRVNKAYAVNADLFVSIHADAFLKPNARGSSVFVLSEHGASSSAARWLAKRENAADLIGGVHYAGKNPILARTLLDLSQTATINDSLKLGNSVIKQIGGINSLHSGMVERAAFAVLKAPDIPSILVETAFISNPEEEKRLIDDAYQQQMASAILKGVNQYFLHNPPRVRAGKVS